MKCCYNRKTDSRLFAPSQERGRDLIPDYVYPDDVFVVSYPRSGNTWVLFILTHLITRKFDDSVDFKVVQRTTPDIHMVGRYRISLDVPRPRIIKSHASFMEGYPKVVYLIRDGRDVAVSFYYYQKKFSMFNGTFYDFIKADFSYQISWTEHINSWLFQEHNTALLPVRYEDLLTDGLTEIRKLCAFAGISATDKEITRALELTQFDRLRKLEEERGLGYVASGDENYRVVRKGKKGDWQEHFDQATKELFKERHQLTLEKLAYVENSTW